MKLKNGGLKKPVVNKSTLQKSATAGTNRIDEITAIIKGKEKLIADTKNEIALLSKERLELQIAPFKLGDTVLAEVQVGKTRKETECVLEAGEGAFLGTLYVRPIKANGELSGRRFSICPTCDKGYKDLFKKKQ